MDLDFDLGQKLVVELLTAEIFEGHFIGGGKNRIDLMTIIDSELGDSLERTQFTFYRSEIRSVHALEPKIVESLNSCHIQDVIKMEESEYDRLKELSKNCIYLATIDTRFYDAIKRIEDCENIGIVGLSSKKGRSANLSLLVISTWNCVYVFDIFLYNQKIPNQIVRILQMKEIKKIIHDSRSLIDCLHHNYKVEVSNLFDTQVADVLLKKSQEFRNIGECLSSYFNFPGSLLESSMKMNPKLWRERPITTSRAISSAQLAVYLIPLKNHFERELLKDFYEKVEKFSTSTLSTTGLDTDRLLNCKKLSEACVGFTNNSTKENLPE